MKKRNHVRKSEASETVQAVEENKVTERKGKNCYPPSEIKESILFMK